MISGDTWTNISPYWSYFEGQGSSPADFSALASDLPSRLLIVGAGQGVLLEQAIKIGKEATGLEGCIAMAEAAWTRRSLKMVVCKAEDMIFPDNKFGSVFIASGVLAADDIDLSLRIISECRRVARDSATIVLAVTSPTKEALEALEEKGVCRNRMQDWSCQVDTWRDEGVFDGRCSDTPVACVASQLRSTGIDPEVFMREEVDFSQRYFDPRMISYVISKSNMKPMYTKQSECGMVSHMVCQSVG